MKALFIGGTGVISTAVGALALARGWELTLLNRGTNAARAPRGARVLTADIHDEAAVKAALGCGGRGNCHRHRRKPFCNFMCYLYRA